MPWIVVVVKINKDLVVDDWLVRAGFDILTQPHHERLRGKPTWNENAL